MPWPCTECINFTISVAWASRVKKQTFVFASEARARWIARVDDTIQKMTDI